MILFIALLGVGVVALVLLAFALFVGLWAAWLVDHAIPLVRRTAVSAARVIAFVLPRSVRSD